MKKDQVVKNEKPRHARIGSRQELQQRCTMLQAQVDSWERISGEREARSTALLKERDARIDELCRRANVDALNTGNLLEKHHRELKAELDRQKACADRLLAIGQTLKKVQAEHKDLPAAFGLMIDGILLGLMSAHSQLVSGDEGAQEMKK